MEGWTLQSGQCVSVICEVTEQKPWQGASQACGLLGTPTGVQSHLARIETNSTNAWVSHKIFEIPNFKQIWHFLIYLF